MISNSTSRQDLLIRTRAPGNESGARIFYLSSAQSVITIGNSPAALHNKIRELLKIEIIPYIVQGRHFSRKVLCLSLERRR